ncbi:MAG TPA: hypothetical protein VEQ59_03645, partial [Polyangiaceae bacterium]|nr:hypothetical protein [Polyangiaceae bacterium]
MRDSSTVGKRATARGIALATAKSVAERVRRLTGAAGVELETKVAELWGGYGELWRGTLTQGSETTSVIVKHVQPPPGEQGLSHRRKLRSYAVEQAFYERYAARCAESPSCRVPRPIKLQLEAGGWLFVLEDLDASGFSARRTRAEPSEIRATLRWLAAFHARFLGTAPEQLWKTG